jgi:hypothetical protein
VLAQEALERGSRFGDPQHTHFTSQNNPIESPVIWDAAEILPDAVLVESFFAQFGFSFKFADNIIHLVTA